MNFIKAYHHATTLKEQLHKLKDAGKMIPAQVYPEKITDTQYSIRLDFHNGVHPLVAQHIIHFCNDHGLKHEHTPIALKRCYITITTKF